MYANLDSDEKREIECMKKSMDLPEMSNEPSIMDSHKIGLS